MKSYIPITIILALASFGLVYSLINNPKALFLQLLFIAIIISIAYGIYIYLIKKNLLPQTSSYQRAYPKVNKAPVKVKKPRVNREHSFKVIEGNKEKKKG